MKFSSLSISCNSICVEIERVGDRDKVGSSAQHSLFVILERALPVHTNAKLSVWEKDQPAKTLSPLKVHFSDRLSHGNHCVPWPIAAGKVCVSLSYFLLFSHIFQTALSKMVAVCLEKEEQGPCWRFCSIEHDTGDLLFNWFGVCNFLTAEISQMPLNNADL